RAHRPPHPVVGVPGPVQGGPPPGTCPVSSTPSPPPGTVTATPPHRPAPGTAAHARDRVGSVVEHRRPRSRAGRGHREDRGGIIVEFAAVVPFLMLAQIGRASCRE